MSVSVNSEYKEIQSPEPRNPLVSLQDDPMRLICAYLQDNEIGMTSQICKGLRDNSLLIEERDRAKARQVQKVYLKSLLEVFSDRPIHRLPFLDLSMREEKNAYIDFLKPEDMEDSVMRFKDKGNRHGVALKIQKKEELGLPNKALVLTIFQRYSHKDGMWVHAWGGSDQSIECMYNTRHAPDYPLHSICTTCPFSGYEDGLPLKKYVLSNLLQGKDENFCLSPPGEKGPLR